MEDVLPWRFIESGEVTLSNEYPEGDTPAEAQYLAISSRYGYTVVYTWKSHLLFIKTAQLFALTKAKANILEGAANDAFQAPVSGFVRSLYLSSDELVIALAKRRSVLFFSAKALESKNPAPLGKVRICASKEEEVTKLTWHPVVPNLLLALSSKGKITLIDSATLRSYEWGTSLPSNIVSLSWSLSGKAVICGCDNGEVLLVTKDGQQRSKIPRPDTAFPDEEAEAHQVLPIASAIVGVAYRLKANPGESTFHLLDLSKASAGVQITPVDYIGMASGERANQYHFARLKDWNLLVIGGSNFSEIEVLSPKMTEDKEILPLLSLNDSYRAQVPMRGSDDNHLLGMTFDFTYTESTPDPTNADRTPFAPSPVFFMLVDEGKLVSYVFVKMDLPKDDKLKLPFMVQPVALPAVQRLQPLTEKPDVVPTVALSPATAAPAEAPAVTPQSPAATRSSLRQASQGITAAPKPVSAPTTSALFPAAPATGAGSFAFPALPGGGAGAGAGAAPFAFKGFDAPKPAAESQAAAKTPAPTLSFATPSTASASATSFQFPSLPQTESKPPAVVSKPTPLAGAAALSAGTAFTMPASSMDKPKPSGKMGDIPKPAAGTTVPKPAPTMAAPAPVKPVAPAASVPASPKPKPREPLPLRPVVGPGGDAVDLQNQFMEQIDSFERVLEEVRETERETAKLMQKIQHGPAAPGEFTVAGLMELRNLTDQLTDDMNFIGEQNVQQQQTHKQIHDQYFEAMGRYTDADSLFHAKTDKQYQQLLANRKLDAESAAMRKNIQKLSTDVETKITEVETHLQRMWNAQRRKEKKSMRAPMGDTLYRTLKTYEEIAQGQAQQLQDMTERFARLRMRNQSEYASTLGLSGLDGSPAATTGSAKKSPFPREQRRRLSVLDRERNGEDEDGVGRRSRELPVTPDNKAYSERMQELKKVVVQRVRTTPKRSPISGKPSPAATPNRSTTNTPAATPTTPLTAGAARTTKPAPPSLFGGENGATAAAAAAKPSPLSAGSGSSSFAFGLPMTSLSSGSGQTAPKAGATGAPPPSATDKTASGFGVGGLSLPSFNVPETKPLLVSSPTSPPQRAVNLASAYVQSDSDRDDDSEGEDDSDSYPDLGNKGSSTAGFKESTNFDFPPMSNPLAAPPGAFSFGGNVTAISSASGKKNEAVGLPKPTPTTAKPAASGATATAPATAAKPALSSTLSAPSATPKQLGKSPVAKSLFGSTDETPTFSFTSASSSSSSSSSSLSSSSTPSSLFSFSTPAGSTSSSTSSSSSSSLSSSSSSSSATPAFSFSSLTTPAAASTTAASTSASAPSTASTASALPSFTFSSSAAASTSTAAAPSTTSATTSAATNAPPALTSGLAASSTAPATASSTTSTAAPSAFASFSFGGDKPAASSGLAASSTPLATAPGTMSSAAPFGSFSFSSAPAASASAPAATALGATTAPSAAAAPFGSFSFSSPAGTTPAATTPATATAPAAAAPASSGPSAFGSFSFSSPAASSATAAPFGSAAPAAASTPATGGMFGGLSLGSSTTPSTPAANPFGAALGASTTATTPATGSSLFGAAPASTTSSLFGGASTPAASPFGAATTTPGGAGGGMSLFGTTSALPTLASSTPAFGSTTTFGAPAATSAFGQPAAAAPAATSAFGAPSALGGASSAFGQPAFGAPSALGSSGGFGGFGSSPAPAFGATSAFGSVAASPAAASTAGAGQRTFGSGFGAAASSGGGGFASLAGGGATSGFGGGGSTGFSGLVSSTPSPFGAAPGGDVWGAMRK